MKVSALGRVFSSSFYNKDLAERNLEVSSVSKASEHSRSRSASLPSFELESKSNVDFIFMQRELVKTNISHRKKPLYELATKNHKETAELSSDIETKFLKGIKRLVVIGDSLSDSHGRMRSKTLGIMLSSRQYHEGRFTNGFVWPDFISSDGYLKKYIKDKDDRENFKLFNYAEGGAVTARYSKLDPTFILISHMSRQIRKHEKKQGFKQGDMVVLALSANDYMTFSKRDIKKVLNCYRNQITKLVEKKGVKHILVTGVPDLSTTAYAHQQGKEYQDKMSKISHEHNIEMQAMLRELNKAYQSEGVMIRFFDFGGELNNLAVKAKSIGYNTKTEQQAGYVDLWRYFGFKGNSESFDPAHRHVFHDQVHPSQEVHQILASRMCDFIVKEFGQSGSDNIAE